MENKGEIKINVQIMDIVNKCLLKIKSTYDSASLIYHAVEKLDRSSIPPMETDGLPIIITDKGATGSPSKESALNWLFRKVFEDFIVGLNESLIEAYIVVKLDELSKTTSQDSLSSEEIFKAIEEIKKKPVKMYVPNLIEEIEKTVNNKLVLREEIISINKVRSCLVHRNGIVSKEDTNNIEKDSLVLIYRELQMFRDQGNEMVPLTKEDKKTGVLVKQLGFKNLAKNEIFPIGTHVSMDANILNSVTYTCVMFVQELLKSLQLKDFTPRDIDSSIVTTSENLRPNP